MTRFGLSTSLLATTLAAASAHATEVAVCTDRGRAVLELEDAAAPLTVANFLAYVDMGYYSGTVFHRAIPGFVAQAGGVDRQLRPRSMLPAVANESSNGLKNARGAVALARTDDPDSARAQFFVNLADNASLDGNGREPGFTVFARVKDGMAVFDEVGRLPTGAAGPFTADVPTPLVAIKSAVRLDEAALAALPAENREGVLRAGIEAAAAAGDAPEALRLIGHYRSLCAPDDAELGLTEARMALAAGDRRRALFAVEEVLATTDAAHPAYEAAAALQLEATAEAAPTPQAVGGCSPPSIPALPDANVASEAEMVAAQRQVREFVAAGEAHLACLAKIIDDDDRDVEERNTAVGEHNRTVAAMEQIAAAFNERIRIFKARG